MLDAVVGALSDSYRMEGTLILERISFTFTKAASATSVAKNTNAFHLPGKIRASND